MQSTVFPFTVRDLRGGLFGDLFAGLLFCIAFFLAALFADLCDLLLSICESLRILASEMNTRNTRNSQWAAFDASKGIPPRSMSSVASTAPSMCISVVLPKSHALLATIANTVQQVLLAQQAASLPACSFSASVADPREVPVPPAFLSQLAAQASSFTASGAGYAFSLLAAAILPASGRPYNCVVPAFVSTFVTPIPLIARPFLALSMPLFPRAPLPPHH